MARDRIWPADFQQVLGCCGNRCFHICSVKAQGLFLLFFWIASILVLRTVPPSPSSVAFAAAATYDSIQMNRAQGEENTPTIGEVLPQERITVEGETPECEDVTGTACERGTKEGHGMGMGSSRRFIRRREGGAGRESPARQAPSRVRLPPEDRALLENYNVDEPAIAEDAAPGSEEFSHAVNEPTSPVYLSEAVDGPATPLNAPTSSYFPEGLDEPATMGQEGISQGGRMSESRVAPDLGENYERAPEGEAHFSHPAPSVDGIDYEQTLPPSIPWGGDEGGEKELNTGQTPTAMEGGGGNERYWLQPEESDIEGRATSGTRRRSSTKRVGTAGDVSFRSLQHLSHTMRSGSRAPGTSWRKTDGAPGAPSRSVSRSRRHPMSRLTSPAREPRRHTHFARMFAKVVLPLAAVAAAFLGVRAYARRGARQNSAPGSGGG